MIRYVIILAGCFIVSTTSNLVCSQELPMLSSVEYFIDTDPGYGNGIMLAVDELNNVTLDETIDFSGLSPGQHIFGIRSVDNDGIWGHTHTYVFYLSHYDYNVEPTILQEAEYFINSDPGYGNGTQLDSESLNNVSIDASIDLSGLQPGQHIIGIRAIDDLANWGVTYAYVFYLSHNDYNLTLSDLQEAEYFFDNDPGIGNANSFAIESETQAIVDENFDIAMLNEGIHFMGIRANDNWGLWSHTFYYPFLVDNNQFSFVPYDIAEIEYFFDTDQGFGNNHIVTTEPETEIVINENIEADISDAGLHMFAIRAKNENHVWGHTYHYYFSVDNEIYQELPNLQAIEFFIDTDPGFNNGNYLSVASENNNELDEIIDMNGISEGLHTIGFRGIDQNNIWGTTHTYNFYLQSEDFTQTDDISAIEFFINNDAGIGSATSIGLYPNINCDTLIYVPLTDISSGNYIAGFRPLTSEMVFGHTHLHNFCLAPHLLFASDTACIGMPTHFTNLSENDLQASLFWDVDNDGNVDFTGEDDINYEYPQTGEYQAVLFGYFDESCVDSIVMPVQVFGYTEISFNNPDMLCSNSEPQELIGYPLQGSFMGDAVDNNVFYPEMATPGYNVVIYTATAVGFCESSLADTIVVNPAPVVLLGNDTTLCAGNTITIEAGDGFSSYEWFNQSNDDYIELDSLGVGIGSIEVWVLVGNEFNCTASDTLVVSFQDCSYYDINSLFTNVLLFPNPASENIWVSNLKTGSYSITISDASGKHRIAAEAITIEQGENLVFNIRGLNAGLYIITGISDAQCFKASFVVEP